MLFILTARKIIKLFTIAVLQIDIESKKYVRSPTISLGIFQFHYNFLRTNRDNYFLINNKAILWYTRISEIRNMRKI